MEIQLNINFTKITSSFPFRIPLPPSLPAPPTVSSFPMTVRFLGTATSLGVPVIGCPCATCRSADPRDQRSRCALLVETGEGESFTRLLVDCGPDIRRQLLRESIARVDALLITHAHSDHLFGLDDLRPLRWWRNREVHAKDPDAPAWRLPTWAHPDTLEAIHQFFPWSLEPTEHRDGYLRLAPHGLESGQDAQIGPFTITPHRILHGAIPCCGWEIEADGARLGYFPDIKEFFPGTIEALAGLDLLVMDCLRDEPHPTHLNTEEALALVEALAPRQTLFTHFSHDRSHSQLEQILPAHIRPAFDGLVVELGG